MSNMLDPFERIARVKGCSLSEARTLCMQVKKHCKVAPTYSAIAAAIERYKGSVVRIKTLAEEACQPKKSKLKNVVKAKGEVAAHLAPTLREPPKTAMAIKVPEARPGPIPQPSPSILATAIEIEKASPSPPPRGQTQSIYQEDVEAEVLRPAIDSLTKTIARLVVGRLIVRQVEGKIIEFNGNGPYYEADLERLAMRLGSIPYDNEIDMANLNWVVVGHAEYDKSHLQQAVGVEGIRFYTQEEFLGLLLLGDSSISSAFADVQRSSHAGMTLVRALLENNELARRSVAKDSVPSGAASSPIRSVPTPTVQPNVVRQASNSHATIGSGTQVTPIVGTTKSLHHLSHRHPVPELSATTTVIPAITSPPPGPTTPASKASTSVTEGWNSFREPPRMAPAPAITGEFRWPDTTSAPAQEWTQAEPIDLRQKSDLKELGYSVAQGVSIHNRREVLDYAVSSLGLKRVVDHLAWLVLFHRNTPSKHEAVENWRADLEWLRSRHRQGR
jgi:hypothetical protein